MENILTTISNIFSALFVLGTMAAMGLGFSAESMFEPLKRWSVVWRALVVNFVIVPLITFAVVKIIPIQPDYQIGLALVAFAAGAPALPKLIEATKGDVPTSVGVMFLLVVSSVIFIPLFLPIVLQGISIDGAAIAKTMVMTLILPLLIAMFVRWRYPDFAKDWLPTVQQASNIGLLGSVAMLVAINWKAIIGLFGTGAIFAVIVVVALSLIGGALIAGKSMAKEKWLFGFSAAQRNISAAMVIASTNFSDRPDTLVMVIIASILMMVILFPVAGEIGKRRATVEDVV